VRSLVAAERNCTADEIPCHQTVVGAAAKAPATPRTVGSTVTRSPLQPKSQSGLGPFFPGGVGGGVGAGPGRPSSRSG
jgi:hypothetical protein